MHGGSGQRWPARVLLVMPEQWPRALLRAKLLEAGYDVVGARDMGEAERLLAASADRGPIRLVLIDQTAVNVEGVAGGAWAQLAPDAGLMMLASGLGEVPSGPWTRVLRRPLRVGEIVSAVKAAAPLSESSEGEIG